MGDGQKGYQPCGPRFSIMPSAVTPCAERCVIVNVDYCFRCLSLPDLSGQGILLHSNRPSAAWSDHTVTYISLSMCSREQRENIVATRCRHASIHRRGREGENPGSILLQRPTGTSVLASPAKARMWRPCMPVLSARQIARPTYSEHAVVGFSLSCARHAATRR